MRWHIVWYVVNAFFCIFVESEISIKEMKNKRFATGKIVVFRQKSYFCIVV